VTNQAFTEAETQAAIAALVFRLQNRGEADDEGLATEFIAALKIRGWRPTLAAAPPKWRDYPAGDAPVPGEGQGSSAYLAAKAEILARRTEPQPVLNEDTYQRGNQ
jgi:hypothetical protein